MSFRKFSAGALIIAGMVAGSSAAWAAKDWAEWCATADPGAQTCNVHCEATYDADAAICSNPEIDGSKAGIALALILGVGLLVSERRRKTTA